MDIEIYKKKHLELFNSFVEFRMWLKNKGYEDLDYSYKQYVRDYFDTYSESQLTIDEVYNAED